MWCQPRTPRFRSWYISSRGCCPVCGGADDPGRDGAAVVGDGQPLIHAAGVGEFATGRTALRVGVQCRHGSLPASAGTECAGACALPGVSCCKKAFLLGDGHSTASSAGEKVQQHIVKFRDLLVPVPGEEIPLLGAVQIVVDGALGLGRADDVLQSRAEQHRAAAPAAAKFLLSM